MEIHSPNIVGPIDLAGSPGSAGDVIISKGAGIQSIYSADLYTATVKAVQAVTTGNILTWTAPIINNGITVFSPTFFTLSPNRLYKLEAILILSAVTVSVNFFWTDQFDSPVGDFAPTPTITAPGHMHVVAWFRPLVATQVGVECGSGAGVVSDTSSIQITTIGYD